MEIFYSIAVSSVWSVIRLEDEPVYWVIHFAFFFAFIFIPPWSTVFPGFLAAAECRSFIESYGRLFAFLGGAIVLLGLILEVIRRINSVGQSSHHRTILVLTALLLSGNFMSIFQ